jgi:phage/plasmid-like protein (TIGR03299 family)
MAHAVETMVSGESLTPWHGLGTVVEGLLTASEALKLGGLDWTVNKEPLYLASGIEVPDRFAVVRSSDSKPLGVVGGDYKVFQNDEAFSFFDTVVDETGTAHYTSAGSLFGGKRVFLTAKIGDTIQVAGEDQHDLYLLITNSHDGSKAFTAATTMIRAVCNNTVTLALETAKTRWSLRHKVTLEGKAQEARDALKLSYKYSDAFNAEVEKLLQVQVTNDQFAAIVADLLPEQKRQKEKNVEALTAIFAHEATIIDTSAAGNGWGAVNAATFWTDHTRESRSEEARFKSLTDGFASKFRSDVRDRVLELAK